MQAGYWGGVSPHGNIAKNYKTVAVRKERSLIPAETVTMVDADDIDRMYNDFYKLVRQYFLTFITTKSRLLDFSSPVVSTL